MTVQAKLYVGESPAVEISLRDEAVQQQVASCDGSSDVDSTRADLIGTGKEVARATRTALAAPLGYPAFDQALVSGDMIAIALGEGVRAVDQVVRGIVGSLEESGVRKDSIVVVAGCQADADWLGPRINDLLKGDLLKEGDLKEDLPNGDSLEGDSLENSVKGGCRLVWHDPSSDESLCFVAAVDEKPLLMNRELFEADVVLPVGCGRLAGVRDARGPYEVLFPRFTDLPTVQHYQQGDGFDIPTSRARRQQQTDQAGEHLAAPMVVQVVPSQRGGVAAVLAGTPEEVLPAVATLCEKEWAIAVEQRANLVVVTLAGGPEEQTWENAARALHAASLVADEEQSAVALCTEINTPPGPALRKLMDAGGNLEQASLVGEEQSADAAVAWEIYKTLCRGPLFFMSQLEKRVVEDLDMAHIASPQELARLVERSATCLLLNEAQHSLPVFEQN